MIGLASAIVELELLPNLWAVNPDETRFRIRTPAGPVGVTARREAGRFTTVTLTNVESFWVTSGSCEVDGRAIPTELLYGGDYYITVDAERIDIDLDRGNATEIVRFARRLKTAFTQAGVRDPISQELLDVYQVLFFKRDSKSETAKVAVVAPPGVIDRSPCGTGSSALYAKFITEGSLSPDATLTTESIIGSTFTVAAKSVRDGRGRRFVTPLLTGRAYINGFLTIAVDEEDPLANGFAPL
jgi:proline racemase